MKSVINISEAKTHFSKLIERVRMGEEIVVAKAGIPVAKLVPVDAKPKRREPGSARGQCVIHDNFDDPLPDDILGSFYK
jgi:prevent-host-death family protein